LLGSAVAEVKFKKNRKIVKEYPLTLSGASKLLAGLHDHFNRRWLSIEAFYRGFFQPIKCNY